jgi:hypothetical protein
MIIFTAVPTEPKEKKGGGKTMRSRVKICVWKRRWLTPVNLGTTIEQGLRKASTAGNVYQPSIKRENDTPELESVAYRNAHQGT